jgi:hypothetical protein
MEGKKLIPLVMAGSLLLPHSLNGAEKQESINKIFSTQQALDVYRKKLQEKRITEKKKENPSNSEIKVRFKQESPLEKAPYSKYILGVSGVYCSEFFGLDNKLNSIIKSPSLLTSKETNEINNIIQKIRHKNISSYYQLFQETANFSEIQKLVLATDFTSALAYYGYSSLNWKGTRTRDEIFSAIRDAFSGKDTDFGVCAQIAGVAEKYLNDNKIRSATVGVTGHAINISRIQNGTAIINYEDLFLSDSKNIEKALLNYQKDSGNLTLEYRLFENGKFKYKFLSEDGKRTLNFIGYDGSLKSFKENLLGSVSKEKGFKIQGDFETYINSLKLGYNGFFIKAGEITGDKNSPLEKIDLIQVGFKNNFISHAFKYINDLVLGLDASLILGKMNKDRKDLLDEMVGNTNRKKNDSLEGMILKLDLATRNKKGFNSTLGVHSNLLLTTQKTPISGWPHQETELTYDLALNAGASYKFVTSVIDIEPYSMIKLSYRPQLNSGYDTDSRPEEVSAGINFNIKSSDKDHMTIDPYFIQRPWEREYGINLALKKDFFKLILSGYKTTSTYKPFCPDKIGGKATLAVKYENIEEETGFEIEQTNYNREKDTKYSWKAGFTIKF